MSPSLSTRPEAARRLTEKAPKGPLHARGEVSRDVSAEREARNRVFRNRKLKLTRVQRTNRRVQK